MTPQDRKAGKLPHSNLAARAGRWSAQHRKTAVFGWLAFVAIAFVIGGMVGTKTLAQEDMGNGSSQVADRALLDFKDVTEDNSCEVVSRRVPNRRDSRVEDRNEGDQP